MQGCLEAMVAMPTGDVRLFLSTYNNSVVVTSSGF